MGLKAFSRFVTVGLSICVLPMTKACRVFDSEGFASQRMEGLDIADVFIGVWSGEYVADWD